MLTNDDMQNILRQRCEEAGGQLQWAKANKINQGYVSLALSGRQQVGSKIAAALGYEKASVFFACNPSGGDV